MRPLRFDRKPAGQVAIDLCADCQILWFDAFESAQLTPGGTLALFATIAATSPAVPHPLGANLPCPRCRTTLVPTQDMSKATRFSYFRCPAGHGRLTPFMQFLREKEFVRPLPPEDLARLKAAVRVVRCSSCGAPVDLEHDTACRYCHSAITILDPQAVARTVAELQRDQAQQSRLDPARVADAILAVSRTPPPAAESRAHLELRAGVDLVLLGLTALAAVLGH